MQPSHEVPHFPSLSATVFPEAVAFSIPVGSSEVDSTVTHDLMVYGTPRSLIS